MLLIDHFLGSARVRRAIWQLWYPFLTRRLRGDEVLFLNYAFDADGAHALPLEPADEPNRACIQLYHHVATPIDLRGKHMLEVSCGHGGGAAWLTRTLQPASDTGLDLNPRGVAFCRQRHRVDGLTVVRGDAKNLPFAAATFDAVINVEASHCYPSLPRFLGEVARVLRPGDVLLSAASAWRKRGRWRVMSAIERAELRSMRRRISRLISRVARSVSGAAASWASQAARLSRKRKGRDFAGVEGSRIYTAPQQGAVSYRSYHFEKPAGVGAI